MSVQTTYVDGLVNGRLGQLADSSPSDVATAKNAEGSASIPFGVMVAKGTLDGDAELVAAVADHFLGVTLFSHAYGDSDLNTDRDEMAVGAAMNILRKGRVLVAVEEAVVAGGDVRVRHVAGTGALGGFRTTAVAGETLDCSAFCVWRTSAAITKLAVLEVDLTNEVFKSADI